MANTLSDLFSDQNDFYRQNKQYRGRFAPSPSGPLHFGSLIAALASYLQAKKNNGLWFVRLEDIDKPREQPNAVEQILEGLTEFGMKWDTDPNTSSWLDKTNDLGSKSGCLVQTSRLQRYQAILTALAQNKLVYGCQCSRKQIKAHGAIYQQTCRHSDLPLANNAIRLAQNSSLNAFHDLVFGHVNIDPNFASEDYIIKRRDGLFAYQLVVVIDDIDQGISQVVRGADILELTGRQLNLYKLFGVTAPTFAHIPLAVTKPGFKLSKQNHAKAINISNPQPELVNALTFLGVPTQQEPDLIAGSVSEILNWAIGHWSLNTIPNTKERLI